MNKLYVTNGSGTPRYWYIGEAECTFCKKNISLGNIAFHVRQWNRRGEFKDVLICHSCTEKTPETMPMSPIHERRQVFISEVVPPKSLIVLPKKPEMVDGGISVFDAAISNKGILSDTSSCVIDDRTHYAIRSDNQIPADDRKRIEKEVHP